MLTACWTSVESGYLHASDAVWWAVSRQPSRCADLCRRSLSHEEGLIVGEALKDRQSTAKQVQIVLDVAKDVPDC